MTPEEELGMTLDQLIYKYDACGSRVADLLRELKEARPDARRYRWLFPDNGDSVKARVERVYWQWDGQSDWHAAIDRAMLAPEKEPAQEKQT